MPNERKTENLVRKLLRDNGYYDNDSIVVEEQSSDNPKINKLLQTASKTGTGKGYPEFIISFKNKPNDIIVIECKADTKRHKSKSGKRYSEYAVDGVLLYASYLKESFNVMAIAISGETEREKRISHFLWLKNNYTYKDVNDKQILAPQQLFSVIQEQAKPINEDELIKKAIEFNEILNNYSIPETERCTVISAILIALQNKPFFKSFEDIYVEEVITDEKGREKTIANPHNDELIKAILNACESVLKANKISDDKRRTILQIYKNIELNKKFSNATITKKKSRKAETNTVLRDLIIDIRDSILPYINSEIFDVLGQFYTQFIRYAGTDKKTGLVLTPPHITDFFCEIANVTKNDIILDPCCGTGGFLVSAMKYMLKDAGNNKKKVSTIKAKQLIGIEQRADMFTHVCSNMMMRGDGKSHIFHGDCYDYKIKEEIKKEKPTKTFLNPPYDIGEDGQLNFIDNALEYLVKDGIGIAICQMSTVVSSSNEAIKERTQLLEKHTLEAVFSMPDDLFYPVGVVTCIFVFKANTPHPKNKETFFGYFKDDGFVKVKHKGRIDCHRTWNTIQDKLLDAYVNRKSIPGLSVTHKVSANDEWCAEAYMETDYSSLKEDDFIDTIKDFVVYQFLNEEL